jgi:hypothetical protein
MTIYTYMHESPWLTFFIVMAFVKLISWPFRLVNRWIRHLDIRANGWPPGHCDADGNAIEDDEEDYEVTVK